jgi:heme/copper-type cytochrome/quinol oxidase subunit 2
MAAAPGAASACAACYGQSDSPLAEGINWGILTLLIVVTAVLGGFVAMFVYFARRAAAVAAQTEPKPAANL